MILDSGVLIITEDVVTCGLCKNGIEIVIENISFLIVTGYMTRVMEHCGWNRC